MLKAADTTSSITVPKRKLTISDSEASVREQITPLYTARHHVLMIDELIPEGYRRYARLEGLDPSSYFQSGIGQHVLRDSQAFISAGEVGSSRRVLWRFFSMLRNSK